MAGEGNFWTNWALPLGGATVGGMIGGPWGATAGGALGSMTGNALKGSGQPPQRPGGPGNFNSPFVKPGQLGQLPKSSFFGGQEPAFSYFPRFAEDQYGALQQLLQGGMQGIQNPIQAPQYNLDFTPIANEARRNFQTNTIPTLAERFSALGGQGGQRSSAFQGALGSAASGLESQLAALGSQYGLRRAAVEGGQNLQGQQLNLQRITQMLQGGLQPRFENAFFPSQPGFGSSAAQGFGQGAAYLAPLAAKWALGF